MKVLGLIPARGGSKTIPDKNIKPLAGKSLIQRAFECAVAAGVLDRIILSTDSIKIAQATESTVSVHQTFGHARRCLKLRAMPRPVKKISASATAEIFQLN